MANSPSAKSGEIELGRSHYLETTGENVTLDRSIARQAVSKTESSSDEQSHVQT